MSLTWPANGEHNVPSYQISALPYVTSSVITTGQVHRYDFPFVTRFINVMNRGGGNDRIAIGFTENGINPSVGNYITLDHGVTVSEEIRTTTLFVSCSNGTAVDYQLFCGLTTIQAKYFLPLTGSNGHPGVG